MIRLINKILSAKGMKAVTNGEYENIQKYRIARGELKQTIDDYNKILSLFVNIPLKSSSKVLTSLYNFKNNSLFLITK